LRDVVVVFFLGVIISKNDPIPRIESFIDEIIRRVSAD